MNHRQFRNLPRTAPRAFTLVEVMISVAIALLLIIGVSQVFKMSGETAGATAALSSIVRDHRAALQTMTDDVHNCVDDSPLFLISSSVAFPNGTTGIKAGWRDADAQTNGVDPNDPRKMDINGAAVTVKPMLMNDRVPRLDRLGFFARGLYQSQTPLKATVARNVSSLEAYIWVGHTKKTDDTLPEDQFASERILGRVAMLLKDPTTLSTQAPITSPGENDFSRCINAFKASAPPNDRLPFLDINTICNDPAGPGGSYSILDSRHDISVGTIDDFRRNANVRFNFNPALGTWLNWYKVMEDSASGVYRFKCAPAFNRPITPVTLSQAMPYFLGHCTQFVVEYTGDYLKQNENTGLIETVNDVQEWWEDKGGAAPPEVHNGTNDGKIDFVVDPVTKTKRIRWYGLPRDINGDGKVDVNDVVPFADVLEGLQKVPGTFPPDKAFAPWEKQLPGQSLARNGGDYANYSPATPGDFKYVCAWHNAAPKMIRVLVKIDDPAKRIQDGQWYEYILAR